MQILFQVDDSHPMLVILVSKKWYNTFLLDSAPRMDLGFTWSLRIHMLRKVQKSTTVLFCLRRIFQNHPLFFFLLCQTFASALLPHWKLDWVHAKPEAKMRTIFIKLLRSHKQVEKRGSSVKRANKHWNGSSVRWFCQTARPERKYHLPSKEH